MTTGMVRKQIYIKEHQQEKLHKIAEQRGISEAEVIRQAIDREAELSTGYHSLDHRQAAEKLIKEALANPQRPGGAYQFNREEIYEDRMSRWIKKNQE